MRREKADSDQRADMLQARLLQVGDNKELCDASDGEGGSTQFDVHEESPEVLVSRPATEGPEEIEYPETEYAMQLRCYALMRPKIGAFGIRSLKMQLQFRHC
ncbi:unnamed protein product [Symbiodinium pilosum]|uniref:Uncharacterized protein n=1 Tax=Symbiodinium pilosum TaxID=2952 RepID=A0A812MXH7_SYMPI|nr:unnamed protein product [Symbiodinium pilosum]